MRVAIVHSYYSNRQPSGENVVVDAQAAALRAQGVDVRIIAARTDTLESNNGYKLRSALTVATGAGPSPLRELKEFCPDIVHVHNLFPNWGTGWLNRWEGPLVATVHNFRPVCAAGTLYRDGNICTLCPDSSSMNAVKYACYRNSRTATLPLAVKTRNGVSGDVLLGRADRVILLSERTRKLYVGFGLASEKIKVIPNFVADNGFTPAVRPGAAWVYVGRLSAEKGIRSLLAHWPAEAALDIYGDGPLRAEVESAMTGNIRYHGQLDHKLVPEVLARARGLVFPSECPEGGIPQAYVEALAAGRTVIARAGSSASDDLLEARSGSVFKDCSDFPAALSAATSLSVIDRQAARTHYESEFAPNVFVERMLSVYRTLADGADSD